MMVPEQNAGRRSMGPSFSQVTAMTVKREPGSGVARRGRRAGPTDRRPRPTPKARPLPSPAVDGTHLSPQALERLERELEWRRGPHRREISQWLERAREHGDIRENADYDAAKNEQGHNEARIRQIEALLRDAVIVEGAADDVVAPGVVVEIRMEGDDEPVEYLVGSIEERHDTYEVLSVSSPLGQALLGRRVGAVVTYQGPRRTLSVEVVGIRPL